MLRWEKSRKTDRCAGGQRASWAPPRGGQEVVDSHHPCATPSPQGPTPRIPLANRIRLHGYHGTPPCVYYDPAQRPQ